MGDLQLKIRDDGNGFDRSAVSRDGLGLQTMALRADFVGGRLDIRSTPGQGTVVELIADVNSLLATGDEAGDHSVAVT